MNTPADYLKIAIITWAAVFVFDRVLKAANLQQFSATLSAQAAS
jgi:hypothetical protein